MRLVTFETENGAARLGALFDGDGKVADLAAAHHGRHGRAAEHLDSMQALIDGGPLALELAAAMLEHAKRDGTGAHARADVRLLAPLPRPVQMRDFLCFEEHLRNSFARALDMMTAGSPEPEKARAAIEASGRFAIPAVWYEIPIYYKCNRMAVIGTEQDIVWPRYAAVLDYELEFAAVVGKRGVDIPRERAREHIFGYTIFNDVSARDYQMKEMSGSLGPAKGKDFDTANVLGPCIVTADEIDPYAQTMVARINGEEWSRGSSSTMKHRFEDCIAHVSQCETIYPGEILGSGTVGGGCGIELGRSLSPGDLIELELDGIGILRNRIVRKD